MVEDIVQFCIKYVVSLCVPLAGFALADWRGKDMLANFCAFCIILIMIAWCL